MIRTNDSLASPGTSGYRGIHLVNHFQPGEEKEAVRTNLAGEIGRAPRDVFKRARVLRPARAAISEGRTGGRRG